MAMTLQEFWAREVYVAIHAQTWRFRFVKYVVLFGIGWGVHTWGGWSAVGYVFATLIVMALSIHFFFRWKSHAWTRSWGPYKALAGLK